MVLLVVSPLKFDLILTREGVKTIEPESGAELYYYHCINNVGTKISTTVNEERRRWRVRIPFPPHLLQSGSDPRGPRRPLDASLFHLLERLSNSYGPLIFPASWWDLIPFEKNPEGFELQKVASVDFRWCFKIDTTVFTSFIKCSCFLLCAIHQFNKFPFDKMSHPKFYPVEYPVSLMLWMFGMSLVEFKKQSCVNLKSKCS